MLSFFYYMLEIWNLMHTTPYIIDYSNICKFLSSLNLKSFKQFLYDLKICKLCTNYSKKKKIHRMTPAILVHNSNKNALVTKRTLCHCVKVFLTREQQIGHMHLLIFSLVGKITFIMSNCGWAMILIVSQVKLLRGTLSDQSPVSLLYVGGTLLIVNGSACLYRM